MKILVTGGSGQLGREISKQMSSEHQLIIPTLEQLDIVNYTQVKAIFEQVKPAAVIHCAAYTNVDGAEGDHDGAFKVNVVGTQNLAAHCLQHYARMVYVSTDYVFDGQSSKDYREYDQTNPLNVYGKTKLLGEKMVQQLLGRHYIIRTAWLYGDGHNFVKTMLRLASERERLQVVNDQVGSPTFTQDLTTVIQNLIITDSYGTYHASCKGNCTWYDFAVKIFELTRKNIQVEPVSTDLFPRPAKRPSRSVLENYMLHMTIGDPMRQWEEALQDHLKQLGQ
ncbi:NAD(P)-dependent oxidoreductase [Sporomusaceae bacterium FL31]|nr:NAD(P)-dependent oxidoreductase [Sporomusaceae bacterium FL31]GCE33878.1 NAD(P)-dependent oxidoreductase [Sporomusaceae bacterium]